MKSLTKLAIVAAMGLLVASLAPVMAVCPGSVLESGGAYIVSNPNWGGGAISGGNGDCGYAYGCYDFQSDPPISSNIQGTFWGWVAGAAEGGNPVFLQGNDNGTWGAAGNWTKQRSAMFTYLYHYPAWFSTDIGANTEPGLTPGWNSTSDIDGCVTFITPTVDNDECTCLLFTDQWDGDGDGVEEGYFALLSDKTDIQANFDFRPYISPNPVQGAAGIIRFARIPDPIIAMAEAQGDTGDVLFEIGAPGIPTMVDPANGDMRRAGDYRDPECPCDMAFKVLAQTVGRGGAPPSGRRACTPQDYQNSPDFGTVPIADICAGLGLSWVPAGDPAGGTQPPTSTDGTTMVRVDCDPTIASDLYLGTQFAGPTPGGSSMGGGFASGNSTRIYCGDNSNVVTDPSRPDRNEGRSDDAPRGRDENRGRGNANGRR